MGEPTEILFGNHRVVFHNDIVKLYLKGIYTPDDFRGIVELADRAFAQYPQVYILIDLSQLDTFPAETRTVWLAWIKSFNKKPPKVSIVGANFTMRAVITMMKALRRLMAPNSGATPELFDTEAQALAYFDQLRRN